MAVAYTVPGPVRSIRSFDRRAGWTFVHAGSELALLGADLDPLGSWHLPAGGVGSGAGWRYLAQPRVRMGRGSVGQPSDVRAGPHEHLHRSGDGHSADGAHPARP